MSIIISLNKKCLLGMDNELAFRSLNDLKRFSTLTKTIGNVVMGSNTWKSLPITSRPLPQRTNIIVTNDILLSAEATQYPSTVCVNSFEDVFKIIDNPCFIGGSKILKSLIASKHISKIKTIYLTEYDDLSTPDNGIYIDLPLHNYEIVSKYKSELTKVDSYLGNSSMQNLNYITYNRKKEHIFNYNDDFEEFVEKSSISCLDYENNAGCMFFDNDIFVRNNMDIYDYEKKYLESLKEIIKNPLRNTRNGYTHSTFGIHFKYDCSNGIVPLLTTKKMAWKTVIKELLWFISGDTNNEILNKQNVHIWDGNASREFLDSRGLKNRKEGDLGPVYGFQWRHWGERYVTSERGYNGIDQLKKCEEMIKNDPKSRRIIMSSWNPSQLDEMALPPCHILIQWYVDFENKLWLQFYQRSGDMFLGIPFNMFSYSVFLHIMAQRTGLQPGGVAHCIGDAHVYSDHVDAINKQLKNKINTPPKISINPKENWEDYTIDDFKLENYSCAEKISANMAA